MTTVCDNEINILDQDHVLTYEAMTGCIRVILKPYFIAQQSRADDNLFVWHYDVLIENLGHCSYTLKKRYWWITNAYAQTSEIKGKGVCGRQPTLHPGKKYEYTSYVPLSTPSGFMEGNYLFESDVKEKIKVQIPMFSLDSPYINMSLQ